MALSERLRFFIESALGDPALRDELVSAIDNATSASTADIHSDGSVPYAANQPMASHKLTSLSAGTTTGDSVRYEQAVLISGVNAFTADQSMGSHKLTNVTNPSSAQDAATKAYVDGKILPFTSSASIGGAAFETLTVTGLLASDTILSVTQSVAGANNVAITGYNTLANNALTITFTADPGAGAVVLVTIKR